MILSSNWGELLEPGLRRIWDKHLMKKKDYLPVLFNVEKSTKAQEFALGAGALGTMDLWEDTSSQVSYEDFNKGYKATYTHKKYSKGIKVEREMLEDDQYAEIKKRVRNLAQSVWYTRQVHAASVFNNAFNNGYPGPDAVSLCNDSHPHSPSDATTQDNKDTFVLNATNLETVRTRMKAWTDDKGNLLAVNPDCLIVPPAKRKEALVIADSQGEPDVADNNVNVWHGSISVIEHDFLTSSTAWFVVDKARMENFLNWFNRRMPQLEREVDFDSEVSKYKTVGRWSFGWDEWSWCYGSTGAG